MFPVLKLKYDVEVTKLILLYGECLSLLGDYVEKFVQKLYHDIYKY
jgi:hypothetical protein